MTPHSLRHSSRSNPNLNPNPSPNPNPNHSPNPNPNPNPNPRQALKPLGSGAFGVAWLVQHSNQRTYALKILNKDAMNQRHWADVSHSKYDVSHSKYGHRKV